MPYQPQKHQHYQNFGGINTKISQYLTDIIEFLKLENVDFQQPGSLTKRWGSTQYFGASLSGRVDGLYEFARSSGASTTSRNFLYAAAGGTFGIASLNGFSSIYSGSTSGVTFFATSPQGVTDLWTLGSSSQIDFITMQNQAIFCNQKSFLKTNGTSFFFFGLPTFEPFGASIVVGSSSVGSGITGIYYYKGAFVNSYGMQGTPNYIVRPPGIGVSNYYGLFTAAIAGATSVSISFNGRFKLPVPNHDIAGVACFVAGPYGATVAQQDVSDLDFYLLSVQGVSTSSSAVTFSHDFDNNLGLTLMSKNVLPWDWYRFNPYDGLTPDNYELKAVVGSGMTMVPKFLETYANMLFMAGVTTAQSSVFYSEFDEPEHMEADFNFEVNPSDGTIITGLKSYNGSLVIFKSSSFHTLTGDSPETFLRTEVSSEYGCLSNRAIAECRDVIVFLDQKGVIQYNGANIEIMSTKVDPIFARMNVIAAQDNSSITYDKKRNQLLVDIPVDGATMANLSVVYDIIAKAWTTYSGYRPAVTAIASGGVNASGSENVFYGGYSGLVSFFGESFMTDNGAGFTCVAKSGFLADMGNSITKLYRRLYTDTTPQTGSTVNINFYQDYGSSIVLSSAIQQTPFQSRLDFGIPAKSLSVEYVMGSSFQLSIHGWVLEDRFLRAL